MSSHILLLFSRGSSGPSKEIFSNLAPLPTILLSKVVIHSIDGNANVRQFPRGILDLPHLVHLEATNCHALSTNRHNVSGKVTDQAFPENL